MQQRKSKMNPPAPLPTKTENWIAVSPNMKWITSPSTSHMNLITPHACTRMKWMKITSYNPARVTPDLFYESHGCLNTSLCMLRRQQIPTTTNMARATNNVYRSPDAWDTQGSYYLTRNKQTPIMCWHGTLNILDQPGDSHTLLHLFRVNRNSPMTLLPLSSLATYTCNGTSPWKLTPPEKIPRN
jgi:hypothetical protein